MTLTHSHLSANELMTHNIMLHSAMGDSVVAFRHIIDFSEEDQYLIHEMKEVFSNTQLGKFKISANAGKSYGEMRKLNIH